MNDEDEEPIGLSIDAHEDGVEVMSTSGVYTNIHLLSCQEAAELARDILMAVQISEAGVVGQGWGSA